MPPVADEAVRSLRRDELGFTGDRAYLDYATFGPLPASHVRAAAEALERMAAAGSLGLDGTSLLGDVRAEAAALLGCAPRHVCLLTSTSEGLGLVAEGLDWREGDEIVVNRHEFEGCLAPFLNLRPRGVRIRAARAPDEIVDLIGPRTRAVCLSVVDRATGARAPVEAIAEACAARGAWLALDAAQAMGVLSLDATALGADVLSAHGYKFLLSGFGLAPTYCSERALAELRVPRAGWKNARLSRHGDLGLSFADGAERFEPTMSSIAVLAGMRASLRLLNGVDGAERERRALAAARMVAEGLAARGFELLGPEPAASAVVSARHRALPAQELVGTLRRAGVVVSAVEGCFRVSTHFVTDEQDVERLLAAIPPA